MGYYLVVTWAIPYMARFPLEIQKKIAIDFGHVWEAVGGASFVEILSLANSPKLATHVLR